MKNLNVETRSYAVTRSCAAMYLCAAARRVGHVAYGAADPVACVEQVAAYVGDNGAESPYDVVVVTDDASREEKFGDAAAGAVAACAARPAGGVEDDEVGAAVALELGGDEGTAYAVDDVVRGGGEVVVEEAEYAVRDVAVIRK